MALVKINIPGIGEVTAENAASEETLLRLVAAMEKQAALLAKKGGSGGGGSGAGAKESKDLLDAKKKETKAAEDSTRAVRASTKGTEDSNKAQKKSNESLATLQKAWDNMKPGLGQAGGALIDFGASVGKTAVSVATAFAKSYDEMAKNPIGAGQTMLNTGIDLAANAAKAAADVLTGGAKSIGGLLGPFSGAVTGAADGFNAAAKAAIDLAVTLAKTANDVFAKEFQKSVDALKSYTAQGASFAGGMTEMRTVANGAGLSLKTLADSAKMASADFRGMGLSQGEGVKKLAKGMEAASKTIGKSGGSLRDEMLGLGYSYEEQGAMMAQMMALQKAAGNERAMSDKEVAQKTSSYARDLKVLADITGKDAKKAMEEAQKASMKADIMSKMTPEQAEKFQKAYAAMPDYAKKGFLQYISSGGKAITDVATNVAISQNAKVGDLIKNTTSDIYNQNKKAEEMNDIVLTRSREAGEAQKQYNQKMGNAITSADTLLDRQSAIGTMQNEITASGFGPSVDQIKKGRKAVDDQAEATDSTTKGYQRITKAANDAAVVMEGIVGGNLGLYADTLAKTYEEAQKLFVKGMNAMRQMLDGTLFGGDGGKAAVTTTATKASTAKTAEDKAYKDATILQKVGIGTTEEQAKASRERDKAVNEQYQAQISNIDAAVAAAKQEAKERREQGKANGEFMAKLRSFFHGEGFAKGGIATGPKTGYPAMLHGTEAVIPLEGGKKVPLDVSTAPSLMGDFAKAMQLPLGEQVSGVFSKAASIITPSGPGAGGPVDLSKAKSLDAELTNTIGTQFSKLSELFTKTGETKQAKPTAARADNSEQLLKELKEIMATQLTKQDEMIDKLSETVDINQRLLTNSYS